VVFKTRRSEARLAKPFDKAGLAGMSHVDCLDSGPEILRFAIARSKVAEVRK
jgi:hypothetical protein